MMTHQEGSKVVSDRALVGVGRCEVAVQYPQYPAVRFWDKDPGQQRIRLTHSDRDAVAGVLREAYSKGQLDDEEFEDRLDLAMRAKIEADIVPLTVNLGI